jgi:hypothetical protein
VARRESWRVRPGRRRKKGANASLRKRVEASIYEGMSKYWCHRADLSIGVLLLGGVGLSDAKIAGNDP